MSLTEAESALSKTLTPGSQPVARSRLRNPTLRAYAALGLGILCIGFSAIFTKWAGVPGPVSAFYRVAIATVALAFLFALSSALRPVSSMALTRPATSMRGKALGLTALAGLFFALDLGFWNTSLEFTSAANSTLLGNTSTLWVSLGAAFIFHESLKRRFWLGMLLALAGAVAIVGPDVAAHPALGFGDLLSLMSSFFYAGYLLGTGRARQYLGTLRFMWLSSVVATASLLAYVLAVGDPLTGFSLNTWLSLIALGLISHLLGWMAINYSLGHLPASITAVTLLSQPVITAILAVPLLGEGLSIYQIGGGLLVLLGIYIVNRR